MTTALAFDEVGLALGALALGGADRGPSERIEAFLLRPDAPEALWRPLALDAAPSPRGLGTVVRAPRARLVELAPGDPVAATLLAAAIARDAPAARVDVMGIVNVTPDSFSEGGRHATREAAIEHGLALVADGADLLDIGGESTRPGATPVPLAEELRRVLPVVEALAARTTCPLSIDTTKAAVARAAVAAGARIVNDVSAGELDGEMLPTVAELGVGYVAMHRRGSPADMQQDPTYTDPVLEVAEALRRRTRACLDAGIQLPRIWLDPGIGFGKRLQHNLALLARTRELRSLGLPLLVGASRKSFIAHVLSADDERAERGPARAGGDAEDRLGGTAAAVTVAVLGGARVLRVHDVRTMRATVRVAEALAGARSR